MIFNASSSLSRNFRVPLHIDESGAILFKHESPHDRMGLGTDHNFQQTLQKLTKPDQTKNENEHQNMVVI